MTSPLAEHYYGPKRTDKYVDCRPWCSAVFGVRVPDTLAGRDKHDAMHDQLSSDDAFRDTFGDNF